MEATKNETLLATGELSWPRGERVTDRYGAVTIQLNPSGITPENADERLIANEMNESAGAADEYADFADAPAGKIGTLVAEVVEARESYHIGDLFHGFGPAKPEVGERVELGRGRLFVEEAFKEAGLTRLMVGLEPVEAARSYRGRALGTFEFWLDPERLYRCHAQTVRLYFAEETVCVDCGLERELDDNGLCASCEQQRRYDKASA
jgi:hypothetical protein